MSADLLERSRALKERAEAASRGIEAQTEAARFREAARLFGEAERSVDDLVAKVADVRSVRIGGSDLGAYADQSRRLAGDLSSSLETTPLQRLAIDTHAGVTALVHDVVESLHHDLEHWAAERPRPEDRFLDVMSELARAQAKRMREALLTFDSILPTASPDLTGLDRLAAAGEAVDEAYAALTAALPEDVSELVRTVARPGGAPLDEMKPAVLQWLRDRSVDRSFVIHFRRR